jgi:hypothetical protein
VETPQVGTVSLDNNAIALHAITPNVEHCSGRSTYCEAGAAPGEPCGCVEQAISAPARAALGISATIF